MTLKNVPLHIYNLNLFLVGLSDVEKQTKKIFQKVKSKNEIFETYSININVFYIIFKPNLTLNMTLWKNRMQ